MRSNRDQVRSQSSGILGPRGAFSPRRCLVIAGDDASRPLDVTLAFNVAFFFFACLPPRPRVYLSGRYRGRPAVSSAGPHCYVTAAGSTVTHVKEAENDLIHSATSRNPPSPLSPPPPPSIPLPSFCLRSIYYSICLFPQEVQLALAHMQARAMDPRDKAAI